MKAVFKRLLTIIIIVLFFIEPILLSVLLKTKLFRFSTISIYLSKKIGFIGIIRRRMFYKKTLDKCGDNLTVHYGAIITFQDIEIGDNCAIEPYCIIGRCSIGDDVIIASRVTILSGGHLRDPENLDLKFNEQSGPVEKVKIGNDLWIGTHAVIMADVGDRVAIGAGSVVTREIPSYCVAAGVPAKVIRRVK